MYLAVECWECFNEHPAVAECETCSRRGVVLIPKGAFSIAIFCPDEADPLVVKAAHEDEDEEGEERDA